jgi:hypothetical protein
MDTMLLPPDFREFLRLLNSKAVEYLIIGGYECYAEKVQEQIDGIPVNLISLARLKKTSELVED